MRRLPWPWLAHHLEHPPCHSRTARSVACLQLRRGPAQRLVAEQRRARRGRPHQAAGRLLGGGVGRRPHERLDTGLEGLGQVVARRRLALHRCGHPVADPADLRLERRASARRCRRTPASGPSPRRAAASRRCSPRRRVPAASSKDASTVRRSAVDGLRLRVGRSGERRRRARPGSAPHRQGCAARPRRAATESAASPCSQVRTGSTTSGGSSASNGRRLRDHEERCAAEPLLGQHRRPGARSPPRWRPRGPGRGRPRRPCPAVTAARRNSHGTASA